MAMYKKKTTKRKGPMGAISTKDRALYQNSRPMTATKSRLRRRKK